jgi:hypothetical protein
MLHRLDKGLLVRIAHGLRACLPACSYQQHIQGIPVLGCIYCAH